LRLDRQQQQRDIGPETVDETERTCPNCQYVYKGRVCPQCGQPGTWSRYTWRQAFFNFLDIYLIGLAAMVAALVFTSCDPLSSVEYNIHNKTGDTVTVSFYSEMMSSPFQGYDIRENDSVTTHYEGDSCRVAFVAPDQRLIIHRQWHGLYREEQLVHAWRYISSIKVGTVEAAPSTWDNEAAWHHRSKGGGNFAKEESHYYDLWFMQ